MEGRGGGWLSALRPVEVTEGFYLFIYLFVCLFVCLWVALVCSPFCCFSFCAVWPRLSAAHTLPSKPCCLASTQASLMHPPTVLLPSQGAPHTTASPVSGVPHTGVNLTFGSLIQCYGHASDDP